MTAADNNNIVKVGVLHCMFHVKQRIINRDARIVISVGGCRLILRRLLTDAKARENFSQEVIG